MIVSITAEGWKSIENAKLDIDPLTVIIGTNSSGKSNFLDAIAFLARIANGAPLTSALQGDAALPPLRGGMEWAARKPGDTFALSIVYRQSSEQDLEYRLECMVSQSRCEVISEHLSRQRFRVDKRDERLTPYRRVNLFWTDPVGSESPTLTARLYNEKAGTSRQLGRAAPALYQLLGQKLRSEIQEGIDLLIGALRNIFILDPIPSHMRRFSPLSDRLEPDANNIAGVIAALPEDSKLRIEDTLTEYASRLPEGDINRVYAETVGRFKADAMLYSEEAYSNEELAPTVDARGMSDGTLRFLAILTALLTRPSRSLLVIEEVDNGLHPSRSALLLELFQTFGRKRQVDVIVTTHNPALLDAMGTIMVPFITVAHRNKSNGATQLTLLEDINNLPKLLASGPVGRISSSGLIEKALHSQSETADV